jgi:uncharacterized protein (TIGR03000 family)
MYSVVLATVLTAGAAAPDLGWRSHGCGGCYGAAYGGCYGVCYGGWGSCYGCNGCFGGCYGGCYGGCGGCFGGCWGSWYGCHGCYGWNGCHGCYGCNGGYYGCHGCYGGGYVVPAVPVVPAQPEYLPRGSAAPYYAPGTAVVATKRPATVLIKAASDVTVTVNGQATNRKTESETFRTPDLQVGRTYAYDVVAEAKRDGKTIVARKRVEVRAGQQSEVNFGDMSEAAAYKAETARVTVLLPKDGTLFVDGKEYGNSAKQTFDTPKLAQGKTYFYILKVEVKAEKKAAPLTKRVTVEAGKDVTVDFRSDNMVSR